MRAMWSVPITLAALIAPALGTVFQHISELSAISYDFIIVGGGTAGAVVSNRLSENPKFEVLVIEAGPSNQGVVDSIIPGLWLSLQKTIYDWNYTTVAGSGINNRSLDYPRGRLLGGCSSHNDMFYTRGSQDDFDRWANVTGDSGWSWNSLIPYILKSEKWTPPVDGHDTHGQFDPTVHGFNGMVSTSLPDTRWQIIASNVSEVPKELPSVFPFVKDMNSGKPLGLGKYICDVVVYIILIQEYLVGRETVGWVQTTTGEGERSSSATAYLSNQFTSRKNLHVLVNTKVTRIIGNSRGFFTGVEIAGSSQILKTTKEIILSAGAINTPQILLNSGIGDMNQLNKLNIRTILDLPSVGQNFTDHPRIVIKYAVNSHGFWDSLATNTKLQDLALNEWNHTRTGPYSGPTGTFIAWSRLPSDFPLLKGRGDSSAGPNSPHMELIPVIPSSVESVPGATGSMSIVVVSPKSRGSVTLNTSNPLGNPKIDPGFFTDPEGFDIATAIEAVKLTQTFYAAPIWKDYIIERTGPPANATDAEIGDFLRNSVVTIFHGASTAAMSPKGAKYGVVDPDLRVKGASGLRVVDASVMSLEPSPHHGTSLNELQDLQREPELAVSSPEEKPGVSAGISEEERANQKRKDLIQFLALCYCLGMAGWNDGTAGPLLPTLQEYYNVGFTLVSMIFVGSCSVSLILSFQSGILAMGTLFQLCGYAIIIATPPFPVLVCAYVLAGFGVAQCNGFVAGLSNDMSLKLGLLQGAYGIGAFSAPFASTYFSKLPGRQWSYHFIVSTVLTVVNMTAILYVFRFKRQEEVLIEAGQEPINEQAHQQRGSKYRQIFSHQSVPLFAIFALIYIGVEVTLGGWIVTFIIRKRGGGNNSGYISSGFFGGLTIGRLCLMWLNKMVGEYRVVTIYALIAIGLELTVWFIPNIIGNAVSVSLVGVVLGPMYPLLVSHMTKILPKWLLTGSVGLVTGIGVAGSAALPLITGVLASRYGIASVQPLMISMMSGMVIIWAVIPKSMRRPE
uniref:pyranose dehydrogenase (acceptor) n=1 Tax=Psilocybe cubensis TaxID=181762 RepID=A0A8H7XKR5_PSICU